MDEILRKYIILIIFLTASAAYDLLFMEIPMVLVFFAFFGWIIADFSFKALGVSSAFSLAVYFLSELTAHLTKGHSLGRGDIYIIFISGLFLDPDAYLNAVFLSCCLAAFMAAFVRIFLKTGEFPMALAFLFGTIPVLW